MNNRVHTILKERNIHPKSYIHNGKVYIIEDGKQKFVLKLNTNNYDIYEYLKSREFIFYPESFNTNNDNYDLYLYNDNTLVDNDQRISDYLKILGILHQKTFYFRQIDLDEIKETFEKLEHQISNTRNHYSKLNDYIDHQTFLSPSMYLLVRNISLIYKLLDYASNTLNEWYIKMQEDKKIEVALNHNNIDLSHLIINKEKYLISWDRACFDNPINDLENFIRKYYGEIPIVDIISQYQKYHLLSKNDYNLLMIHLAIPKIINLTDNVFEDTIKLNSEISLLSKVYDLILLNKK